MDNQDPHFLVLTKNHDLYGQKLWIPDYPSQNRSLWFNSWFGGSKSKNIQKNHYFPDLDISIPEYKDKPVQSRKVQIYPTQHQKSILIHWMNIYADMIESHPKKISKIMV